MNKITDSLLVILQNNKFIYQLHIFALRYWGACFWTLHIDIPHKMTYKCNIIFKLPYISTRKRFHFAH